MERTMETFYIDSLFENEFYKFSKLKYVKEKELHVSCVEKGVVITVNGTEQLHAVGDIEAGVVGKDGNYVAESRFDPPSTIDGYLPVAQMPPEDEIEKNEEKVIFLGFVRNQWGHFLMDSISRMWYFLSDKNCEHRWIYFGEELRQGGGN